MTFGDWRRDAVEHVRNNGLVDGGRRAVYEFYLGALRQLGQRWNYGRRIYEHEWDLLVVLDACRADLMAEVADEYEFLTTETAYSCASSSGEWTRKNFADAYADERRRTALVSANPFTELHLDETDFSILDEVWRYAFDRDVRTVRAEAVVDRTIRIHREYDLPRTIAHLMQPHYPFLPNPMDEGLAMHETDEDAWDTVWDRLRKGEVFRADVWEGYKNNLRYALDHVEVLLDNVDADRVIITADHGNLLGEFGLYGHPQYVPITKLKRVPWVVTSATDTGSYEPSLSEEQEVSVEEHLDALGYV